MQQSRRPTSSRDAFVSSACLYQRSWQCSSRSPSAGRRAHRARSTRQGSDSHPSPRKRSNGLARPTLRPVRSLCVTIRSIPPICRTCEYPRPVDRPDGKGPRARCRAPIARRRPLVAAAPSSWLSVALGRDAARAPLARALRRRRTRVGSADRSWPVRRRRVRRTAALPTDRDGRHPTVARRASLHQHGIAASARCISVSEVMRVIMSAWQP